MTTMTVVERIAAPARLEVAIERLTSDDATISDVRALLHQLTVTDDVDAMRMLALVGLANVALGRFSAGVTSAPPAALNDLVRDAEAPCRAAHLGCVENVQFYDEPWCSRPCQLDDEATRP